MSFQDILLRAGPHGQRMFELWEVTLTLCVIVFLAIAGACLYAIWRGRRGSDSDRLAPVAVTSAITHSTAGLLFLVVASAVTDRPLAEMEQAENALTIELTAQRWGWEYRSCDEEPWRYFITAKEREALRILRPDNPAQYRGRCADFCGAPPVYSDRPKHAVCTP